MGQRHQIYLVLPETSKVILRRYDDELPNCIEENMTNIIPLHNQWLYGRRALEQLKQFLIYCSGIAEEVIENTNDTFKCYHPFVEECFSSDAPEVFKSLYSMNLDGYWHSTSIESIDLAKDPTLGDNNDGITIIDIRDITKPKYCFMYLWDEDELTAFKPLSALKYVRHYYPYGKLHQGMDIDESEEFDEELIALSKEISSLAKLMTKEEVIKIFPTLQ